LVYAPLRSFQRSLFDTYILKGRGNTMKTSIVCGALSLVALTSVGLAKAYSCASPAPALNAGQAYKASGIANIFYIQSVGQTCWVRDFGALSALKHQSNPDWQIVTMCPTISTGRATVSTNALPITLANALCQLGCIGGTVIVLCTTCMQIAIQRICRAAPTATCRTRRR